MQETGNQPPAMVAARGLYMPHDLRRSCAMFGVPLLDTPTNFFSEVARAILGVQRLLVAAQQDPSTTTEDLEALVDAFTYNVHMNADLRTADNELKINEAFMAQCLSEAGFSQTIGQTLISAMSSGDIKAELSKNTKEAVARGAFGSPTMFIKQDPMEEFMVFGSDRMEQIAFITGNKYLGANPKEKL